MNPFIVIEALDAGGSQTQTDKLVQRLKKEKYQTHQYHFPQEDTSSGRVVYDKFLLQKNKFPFTQREQALLYIMDFYSKADEINHWLTKKGKHIVVSDRFYTSTLAYQTIGLTGTKRQARLKWLKWLCEQGTPQLPKPDQVIFLDTPVNISLKHLRNKKKDFFENRQKLTAIRNSYLRIAKEEKWVVIDSVDDRGKQRTIPDLHQEIWSNISPTNRAQAQ